MIIWGFGVFYRTRSTGVFFCPSQGADQPYKLRAGYRFFTIFFIPIIPLGGRGHIVQCEGCRTKFEVSVLDVPTAAQREVSFKEGVRGAVVAVLRSGIVTESSKASAVKLVGYYLDQYSEIDLESDFTLFDLGSLESHLQQVSRVLDDVGRESLLTHLTLVAAADKSGVTGPERNTLDRCAAALGMTEAHCRGTIDSVIEKFVHQAVQTEPS